MTDIIGTRDNDSLTATGSGGLVVGRSGNDTILGSAAADIIYGDNNASAATGGSPNYGYEIIQDRTATVTFQGESAGFRNALGMYRVDANGRFLGVEVLFANASLKNSGGDLIAGQSKVEVDLRAGETVGFFIVPDGFSKSAAALQRTDGTFTFLDSNGQPGHMGSGPDLALWFVPSDGSAPQPVMSQYGTSMFFTLDRLNSDNLSHAHLRTSGDDKTGLVQIGFEDLLNGGDKDFDDSRFSIDVGLENVGSFPTTKVWSVVATDDVLRGGDGDDKVYGGSGKDQLYGENGNDLLDGGTGDDRLWGAAGNDTINGGAGNDQSWGGDGNDTMNGGAGNDNLSGERGDDVLTGAIGNDQFWDGDGNDTANGGSGLDYFTAGRGNDAYNGGEGFDTIDFNSSQRAAVIDLAARTAVSELGTDTIRNIERVLGSRHADTITGSRFADTLEGRDGNDVIRGGAGSDILLGGNGNDTFVYQSRSEFLNTGTGQRFVDIIRDFNVAADKIDVTKLLDGRIGERADMFRLDERAEGTLLSVNMGRAGWFDLVMLAGLKLGDAEKVAAPWLSYGTSVLSGPSGGGNPDNVLWGTEGVDSLNGGAGNDRLWDLGGNDTIKGGGDNDIVTAGRGNDIYNGDAGLDVIDFSGSRTSVAVDLTARTAIGELGSDQVLNFETVIGSDAADRITGNRFAEILEGRGGDDVLRGMQGNDTLVGGAGADTFLFSSRSDLYHSTSKSWFTDVIRDFDVLADKIDISGILAARTGDKSLLVQLDEVDGGTLLKVNLGSLGWQNVAMLEGVMLGDQASVSASWLIV